ncbi:hypothetical protein CVC30_004712, partial [Salmonella enterica subsp. enterica serovar Cerro]|nr:hypothetical protein [Salmonella enterica subsp. enterica serovar Cerro]
KKIFILSAALIMAGCATKQYPQAANVTGPESSALTSSPTFALRDSGGGFPLVGDG